jgi:ubiquinone/menaquinone biosynthesis C-methylase UbiE
MDLTGWKQKHRERNRYNRTAHIYDLRYQEEQRSKYKIILNGLNLDPTSSIMDIGCGTGLLLSELRGVKEIVGLDISREMLQRAKRSASSIDNTHLLLADADHAPLRSNHFDLVFAITLLQNMPSPPSTLQEIIRITKANASIAISVMQIHFPEDCFAKLLKASRMRAKLVTEGDNIKCHIAICKKDVETGRYPSNLPGKEQI